MSRNVELKIGLAPRVDLVPGEIRDARATRMARRVMVWVIALSAVAVLAGYGLAFTQVLRAQSDLDAANVQAAQLAAQRADLADIELIYNQLELGGAALAVGGATDVDWAAFLREASKGLPVDATMKGVSISTTSPLALFPQSNLPLQPSRAASITFTIRLGKFTDLSGWLGRVRELPGFTDVTPAEIAQDGEGGFRAIVVMHVDSGVYSNQFADSGSQQ